ncbi:MAG TPA: hypothetical protein VD930_09085 [Gemmatimonadales bacterium]|nr:hypothetical protein [Gemmatimonadales bacterium]
MRVDQLSAALLLGLGACSGPTAVSEGDFTIRATGQDVLLVNSAERPTFYFLVERDTAAVINFATCVQGPQCPHVAAGATVGVPYTRITGYQPGKREIIVYWWRSVPSSSGPQVERLHSTVLEL